MRVTGAKGVTMRPFVEREDDEVRAFVVRAASENGMLLRGKMSDERRFRLRGEGKGAPQLDGEWGAGASVSKLEWQEQRGRPVGLTAAPLVPFGKESGAVTTGLRGAIGKNTVRAQLRREGQRLTGFYRYARSRDDLQLTGSVDEPSGKFELAETLGGKTTGRLRGTFLDASNLVGLWESPDASRTLPLWLTFARPLAQVVTLPGGVKLVPRTDDRTVRPFCTEERGSFELDGMADRKAQAALNQQLASSGSPTPDASWCEGASAERPYWSETSMATTSVKHSGLIGLALGSDQYTGGAHGIAGSTCKVIDLKAGTLGSLGALLVPGGRERLSKLATEKLKREHRVTDLTEANFFDHEVTVSETPDLCLHDDHVELVFPVYEVAPYVMGQPTVTLSFDEVRPLLSRTPLTEGALR